VKWRPRCNVIAAYILFLCAKIRLHLCRYSMLWQMYAEYVRYCDVSVILLSAIHIMLVVDIQLFYGC